MDNQRTLLFAALAFVAVLIWQAWQTDYAQPVLPATAQTGQLEGNIADDVPKTASEANVSVNNHAVTAANDLAKKPEFIHILTDVYDLKISTLGASISQLKLLDYPVEKGEEEVITLLNDEMPKIFVIESGLIAGTGDSPNHHAIWQTAQKSYTLTDDTLSVPFTWVNENGVSVVKTYLFKKGSYKVDVQTHITNQSVSDWSVREYMQIKRNDFTEEKANSFIYTYTGGVLYTEEDKYQKIDFGDMQDENLKRGATNGWLGMIQHYFGVAWIPERDNQYQYYTKALDGGLYVMGAYSPNKSIPAGESKVINATLFAGPKIQEQLASTAEGLILMVDYGKLTIIAEPIYWLLSFFYSFVGNWGVAIILVTLTIKALFYKLSEKSYRSMAHMKLVQPRIVALKERLGDDKQKMNQAMMELYKTEKINPLGGCLPILVQIPVFISLYWVLLESVDLRQAPFMLWIDNLSAADPYFILPVIYGITMFLQQRLNPAPVDPMQKKMMQMLPIMFTGFFAFFPSGLVLYWIVNNVLTIMQQSYIMKQIESAAKK